MMFDTHAHYNDQAFEEDRKELIESLPLNGIGLAVNVGADLKSHFSFHPTGRNLFSYVCVCWSPSQRYRRIK